MALGIVFGATATFVLFALGKFAIGVYIGRSGTASTYGAAGSVLVLLLWVFYSSCILFFGAEFTRAHTIRKNKKVEPKNGAELLPPAPEAARGQEARLVT